LIFSPLSLVIIIVTVCRTSAFARPRHASKPEPETVFRDVMGDENVPPERLSAMASLRKVGEM